MKIDFIVTIRTTPESREELIHLYGKQCLELQERINAELETGMLVIPAALANVRMLFDSGRWDDVH